MQQTTRQPASSPVDRAVHECRTARGNLPVTHPGLWRFVLEQLAGPAVRLHRHRTQSARLLEDLLSTKDERCQS